VKHLKYSDKTPEILKNILLQRVFSTHNITLLFRRIAEIDGSAGAPPLGEDDEGGPWTWTQVVADR
jgi:hypothetical protein